MAFKEHIGSEQDFYDYVKEHNPHANIDLIKKAYHFASQAHEGQKRSTGEDYFIHPLSVARILAGMRADTATICAALLHDTVEDTSTSLDKVRKEFGDEIATLVEGVTKTPYDKFATKEEGQAEYIRKLLLAMTNDVRVMLIRLADRLHNMRTLSAFRDEKRKRIAKETLEIYAPIAHKLGVWRIKGELEDLSLRYIDFDTYLRIKEQIAEKRDQREKVAQKIVDEIKYAFKKENLEAEIYGRAKYFYSIYKKMLNKKKEIDQIYDLIAIRIITKSIEECYTALQIVHNLYEPDLERLKDYIAHPKPNGYRSIHTTVKYNQKRLEVQIRTEEMHHIAEEGVAAHWRYKGTERDKKFDQKIEWTKQILDWLRKSKNAVDFVETLRVDLFENEIIVLTPKGDPISLPEDASPIDFAFAVHTDVGMKCSKAKVNNKIVPLDYKLKSGDVVEIITSNKATPSRAWLNFVLTTKARSKIRQALGIDAEHNPKQARKRREQKIQESFKVNPAQYLKIEGKQATLKLAKCCEPQIHDDIRGFYAKDGKISVHKESCANIAALEGQKEAKLIWQEPEDLNWRKLRIYVSDRPGVLVEILDLLAKENVDVRSVTSRARKTNVLLTVKIDMDSVKDLNSVLAKISDIEDVQAVKAEV
ncbi:bifunctional (p)ppGpp synthetase/guanosine-3',5'-bis(diphosphate) 3'-pyrophosphohydrolase [Candidatus Woesearchaeota archaeon]|nr:MAG: bifunctional (p)ppGpp synthetase/guanosine-3',5'-bis(diphosphate) 3'-pyrophosphohydrolase [Candidatus Woesearchaeota archaeon]